MRPAGFRNFLLLAYSLLFAGLSAVPSSFSPSLRSGPGAACRLSRAESERRCRAPGQPPGGALCHGRGRCDCGVCICHVSEPGVYFGPLCECHEWVCETYDGSTCAAKTKESNTREIKNEFIAECVFLGTWAQKCIIRTLNMQAVWLWKQ
ncbi:hypothetical protein MC885_021742 [Smutsia gigantea]|nr:hypothetical protein MC885_021742 [Smutsia gigantea]